jgi:ribonuclease HII
LSNDSLSVPASPGSGYAFFDANLRAKWDVAGIVGLDEVGRGPLAGPVVASAVILPPRPLPILEGVKDSKKLTPKKREALFSLIWDNAVQVGIGWALPEEIDSHNILQATFLAMQRALAGMTLDPKTQVALVDGNTRIPNIPLRQATVVGGDGKSLCIASASVIAKVVRDRWMHRLHRTYPNYGFDGHKGYGSRAHIEAIQEHGPVRVHRQSFLRNILAN